MGSSGGRRGATKESLLLDVSVETNAVPETSTSATAQAFGNPCAGEALIGSRPVEFRFGIGSAYSSQVNGKACLHLMEDGVQVAAVARVSSTVNALGPLEFALTSYTPTPGEHTYEVMKSKADAGTTANFIGDNDLDIPKVYLRIVEV